MKAPWAVGWTAKEYVTSFKLPVPLPERRICVRCKSARVQRHRDGTFELYCAIVKSGLEDLVVTECTGYKPNDR